MLFHWLFFLNNKKYHDLPSNSIVNSSAEQTKVFLCRFWRFKMSSSWKKCSHHSSTFIYDCATWTSSSAHIAIGQRNDDMLQDTATWNSWSILFMMLHEVFVLLLRATNFCMKTFRNFTWPLSIKRINKFVYQNPTIARAQRNSQIITLEIIERRLIIIMRAGHWSIKVFLKTIFKSSAGHFFLDNRISPGADPFAPLRVKY